jgi:serine/threonine protein kinase
MSTFEERLKESLSHLYDIERELGGGGMSRVFVATDKSLGRKIVIKLLSPELTAEVNRGRFRREIQVAAQLQHPHIVTLLSAGEDGELVYYTMPFIVGESLKSALDRNGPLKVRDVVRILYDVVDALAYAHEQGVVHRDIKPANILRSGSHALVTDFGVAKALNAAMPSTAMTSTGMAIGTPAYMAPEQLAGDPTADHRIDIYAVGLLAYELLTGKSPFAASSPQAVLAAVLTRDPPPLVDVRPDVPRRLSEMVMACLSKVPGGRPPTAEGLLNHLDLFSTASGEIRTQEHKVPVIGPTVPVVVPVMPTPVTNEVVNDAPAPIAAPVAPVVTAPPVAQYTPPPSEATSPSGVSLTAVPVPAVAAAALPVAAAASAATADPLPTYDSPAPRRNRSRLLIGGAALLVPAVAGAIFVSQRSSRKAAVSDDVAIASSAGGTVAVAAPADSAAIAASIAQRAAAEAAEIRSSGTVVNADSLRREIQREIADSIARANRVAAAAAKVAGAATVASAPATESAPANAPAPAPMPVAAPVAPPPEASTRKRLAIAEPKGNRENPVLNAFSNKLVDALRASLAGSDDFSLVDQDSVRDAITQTSSRDEAAKLLKPDVVVSPGFNRGPDGINLVVTVWDMRSNSSYGIRVSSTRVIPEAPEVSIAPVVQMIRKQLDDLSRMPTSFRRRQ